MVHSGVMSRALILIPVVLFLASCGGEERKKSVTAGSSSGSESRRPEVIDLSPPNPPSIDPDREESIRTGSQVEQLLASYELLVERVKREKELGNFDANRAINKGLLPIAADHHDLFERKLIDEELHSRISFLAAHVLTDHIYQPKDGATEDFQIKLAEIRAMLPEHSTSE